MNKFTQFRGLFEGGFDFETALSMLGWEDKPSEQISLLERQWVKWESRADWYGDSEIDD